MAERVTATGETTSLADRKRRAGQRLMVGFDGLAATADLKALVQEVRPAGFILFGRNIAEPAQVLELTRELRDLTDPAFPAVIAIDQEGGRVQRIGEPATVWPSAAEQAASGQVERVAHTIGLELRAMGIDLNLAPVADVRRSDTHAVIGDRSFSTRENETAACVAAFVRGLEAAHVRACLKHYPGHGGCSGDSHETLPVVELDRPELEAVDARPFHAGLAAGARAVLSAHVLYPAYDEHLPASLSPILQRRLRAVFDGLVLSDDVEMGALAKRWETAEIARYLAAAQTDLILCCHTPSTQVAMYDALVRHQEDDVAFDTLAQASDRRLLAFREQTFLKKPPRPGLEVVGSPDHRALRDEVLYRSRGRA